MFQLVLDHFETLTILDLFVFPVPLLGLFGFLLFCENLVVFHFQGSNSVVELSELIVFSSEGLLEVFDDVVLILFGYDLDLPLGLVHHFRLFQLDFLNHFFLLFQQCVNLSSESLILLSKLSILDFERFKLFDFL